MGATMYVGLKAFPIDNSQVIEMLTFNIMMSFQKPQFYYDI